MTNIFVDIIEERNNIASDLLLDECEVIEDENFLDDDTEFDEEDELLSHMRYTDSTTDEDQSEHDEHDSDGATEQFEPSGMVITSETCTASQPFDVITEQNNYLTISGKIGFFQVLDPLRKCACYIGLNTKLSKSLQKQVISEAVLHTRTIHNLSIEIKMFRLARPIIISSEDIDMNGAVCVRPCPVGEGTFMYFTNRTYLQVDVGEYRMGSCMTDFYTPTDKVHIPKLTDLAITLECRTSTDLYNICCMIAKGVLNTKHPIPFSPKKHDLPTLIRLHRYNCWLSLHHTNRKIYDHIVADAQKQRTLMNKTISRLYFLQKVLYHIIAQVLRSKYSKQLIKQYLESIVQNCSLTSLPPSVLADIARFAISKCVRLQRIISKQPAIGKGICKFICMFVDQQHKRNCLALLGESGSGKTYLATKLNEVVAGQICNVNEGSAEYKLSAALQHRPKCVLLDDLKENGILSLRNRLSMIDGTHAQINVKWGDVGSIDSKDIPFFLITLNDVQGLLRRNPEHSSCSNSEAVQENRILLSRIELIEFSGYTVPAKAKRMAYTTDDILYFVIAVICTRLCHGTFEYSDTFDEYLPFSNTIDVCSLVQFTSHCSSIECTQSLHIGSFNIDVGADVGDILFGADHIYWEVPDDDFIRIGL